MKKLIFLVILSAFVFAVVGCGEGGTNEVQSSSPQGSNETEVIKDPKNENRSMATSAEAGTE